MLVTLLQQEKILQLLVTPENYLQDLTFTLNYGKVELLLTHLYISLFKWEVLNPY